MKENEVLRCQIQEWYPRFCKLSFKTNIHTLDESFVSFLFQDGLFLPRSSEAMPSRRRATCPELQSEDYHHWKEEDDDDDEPDLPSFPDLEAQVKASIEQLGGCVIPKLNWSAPADTAWISPSGSLKCSNFAEVSLLLKASETLSHDLSHAFDACEDRTRERPPVFVLALKKWYDLRPEMEFRAFVREHCLVGVSQREVTSFYPSLLGREEYLGSLIAEFFAENICDRFDLDNYCFDCYVTKNWKVKLMDFNTWGGSTLPLLFTWDELEDRFSTFGTKMEQEFTGLDDEDGAENPNVKAVNIQDSGKSGNGANEQGKEHSTFHTIMEQGKDRISTFHIKMEQKFTGLDKEDSAENSNIKAVNIQASGKSGNGAIEQGKEHSTSHTIMEQGKDKFSTFHTKMEQKFTGLDKEDSAENSNIKAVNIQDSGKLGNGATEHDKEHSGDCHILPQMPCLSQVGSLKDVPTFAMSRSPEQKFEVRIVKHIGLVQPSFRATSGVPIDLIERGPGSSWEQLLQKLEQEIGR